MDKVVILIFIVTVLTVITLLYLNKGKEGYYYFQQYSPSFTSDKYYTECSEACNPADVVCKQRCWLQTFKHDSPNDVCNLVCQNTQLEVDAGNIPPIEYFLCMDKCYGGYGKPLIRY